MDWEQVQASQYDILERQAIAGGWIYRNRYVTGGSQHQGFTWAVSITFVADTQAPLAERNEHRTRRHAS